MSNCGSSPCQSAVKMTQRLCPVNERQYVEVPFNTVLYHLNQPWLRQLKTQKYYFCTDPNCVVVYFAEDDSTLTQADLRSKIGMKDRSADALLCYCFAVTRGDASVKTQAKDYVVQKTRDSSCACEILNPSGRCCLKDFPKPG